MFRLLSLLCNNSTSNKITQLTTVKVASANLTSTEETDIKVHTLLDTLFHSNSMSSIEFTSIVNNLYPYVSSTYIHYEDKVKLLEICADKAVRHEGIICKCIWDVLKTKLESSNEAHKTNNSKEESRLKERTESHECWTREEKCSLQTHEQSLYVTQLAYNTAVTFRIMCEFDFVNDAQMLLLALGRCIELSHYLSIHGIAEVYRALFTLDKTHVSLTDAALSKSNVTTNFLLTESESKNILFYDEEQLEDDCRSISAQPNLIDVLCGELESRLIELGEQRHLWLNNRSQSNFNVPNRLARNDIECSTYIACREESEEYENKYNKLLWCDMKCKSNDVTEIYQNDIAIILRAMTITGVSNALSIKAIQHFIQSFKHTQTEFLIDAFREASVISTRVIDVLHNSVEAAVEVECSALIELITHKLLSNRQIARELRYKPELVLELRRIFETNNTLYEHASELWDVIRCIHISHKRIQQLQRNDYSALTVKRLGGKLFESKYAITLATRAEHSQRPVSYNYTPPEFRKEISLKTRGRQQRRSRISSSPYQRFGVRRIKSSYMHSLRRKYAPTFW